MSNNIIRIKRRLEGDGALSGAPLSSTMRNAELAFNEVDNILYYGKGAGAGGMAKSVIPIAGTGYIDTLVANTSGTLFTTVSTVSSSLMTEMSSVSSTLHNSITAIMGADYQTLATQINSIEELALSLGEDANFALKTNTSLSALSAAITSAGSTASGALTSAFQTLTGTSGVSTLGTMAGQNSSAVNISGGSIVVSSLDVQGAATVNSLTVDTGDLSVSAGNLSITQGTLTVDSTATFGGVVTAQDGVTVSNGNVEVTTGNLTVAAGTATFQGAVSAMSTFDVASHLIAHADIKSALGSNVSNIDGFTLTNCVIDMGTF